MKPLLEFLKTTLISGLFVLLPVGAVFLLLSEMLDLAVAFATPLAALIPGGFEGAVAPRLLAVVLLLIASLVLGLIARARVGRALGAKIERRLLAPIPGYEAVKKLLRSLGRLEGTAGFRPVVHGDPQVSRRIGYLVEEHLDGFATVLFPWSPASMAGVVEVVPRASVTLLEAGMAEANDAIAFWGVGVEDLLRRPAPMVEEPR